MKERIRQVMEQARMSQQDFATKLGISPASLSSIFTGRTNPTNNHVQAIHRAFPKVNVNWLLFGEGEMQEPQSESDGGEMELSSSGGPNGGGSRPPESMNGGGMSLMFEDDPLYDIPAAGETVYQHSPASRREQPTNRRTGGNVMNSMKNLDKYTRKIKEIRVFFDDGTYEAFVPSGK